MADDPDVEEEVWADTLEGLDGEIEIKADAYAVVIDEIKAKVEKYKKEIDRLSSMKKSCDNAIERMKKSLEGMMIATGKTKFATDFHKFGIQKNPASLVINDESKIPLEFLIIKEEINKSALKEAIKAGQVVEGCEMVQTEGLRIR